MSAAPLRRVAAATAYQNQLRLRRAVRTATPHVRQSPPPGSYLYEWAEWPEWAKILDGTSNLAEFLNG